MDFSVRQGQMILQVKNRHRETMEALTVYRAVDGCAFSMVITVAIKKHLYVIQLDPYFHQEIVIRREDAPPPCFHCTCV
jgi:hypothetical protein